MPRSIQAILLDAKLFDRKAAADWLSARAFRPVVEESGGSWRSVQVDPAACREGTFRNATPSEHGMGDGVQVIYADVAKAEGEPLLFRAGAVFADPSEDPSLATFRCSSEAVDSYGDIVVQSGVNLDHWRANPVVLWNHSPSQPIGRAEAMGFDANGDLIAQVRFADARQGQLGEFAESVAKMVKAGFLHASSIGFTSTKREPIYDADGRFTGVKFLESVVKELSVVSVPANADALVVSRSLGIPEGHIRSLCKPAGQTPSRAALQRSILMRERRLGAHASG